MARTTDTAEFFPRIEGALSDADIPRFDDFVTARERQAEERRRQIDEAAATSSES